MVIIIQSVMYSMGIHISMICYALKIVKSISKSRLGLYKSIRSFSLNCTVYADRVKSCEICMIVSKHCSFSSFKALLHIGQYDLQARSETDG